ncbi:hypothetical protein C5167_047726 [Papaver somniferum]|uniref:Uncharacterized protein n=1 Tax=Papaver somniferum TaxID=3469 RepID=A0A4Y7LLK0_PAPSO|nr:hypothetical protein C5167_047726 [Papaver somniferum]
MEKASILLCQTNSAENSKVYHNIGFLTHFTEGA